MEIHNTELIKKGRGEMSFIENITAANNAKTFTRMIMILISLIEMKWYRRACSTFPF
jgi:hypothetical protein